MRARKTLGSRPKAALQRSLQKPRELKLDNIDAIVIGASAGGVEALSTLLPALPANLRVAVFIVLHLPRERPSMLVEIFAPRCALPVREAEDKEPVERGAVYFAPPDYHLLIDRADDDGAPIMTLSVDELVNFSRPSIDVLFETAADVYGERLAGVILTGANEDGAAGLAAVRRAGGVAMVQEPSTAYASYMVEAALKRTEADFVLPLDGIAGLLRGAGTDQPTATTGDGEQGETRRGNARANEGPGTALEAEGGGQGGAKRGVEGGAVSSQGTGRDVG